MHGVTTRRYSIVSTTGDFSFSPSAVSTVTPNSTQTMTVKGLRVGDVVSVMPPSAGVSTSNKLLLLHHYVSAADTLSLVFFNTDVGSLTPTSPTTSDPWVVEIS